MANPLPDIIEVLGARLDGWQPEDGQELAAFVGALPEMLEKVHDTLGGVFADLADSRHITEPVSDASDEVIASLGNAREAAASLAGTFSGEMGFWIR